MDFDLSDEQYQMQGSLRRLLDRQLPLNRLRSLNGTAWAVGRSDALIAQGALPAGLASQIPAITWFTASSFIDSGLRGVVRAEGRDEDAANNRNKQHI